MYNEAALSVGEMAHRAALFEKAHGAVELLKAGQSAVNKLLVKKGVCSEEDLRWALYHEIGRRGDALNQELHPKLIEWNEIAEWRESNPEPVALTSGCFDILHQGHVNCLQRAKRELGMKLFVGVNSDRAVQLLKGPGRPINTEVDRLAVLSALEVVDYVCVVDDTRMADFIRLVRPEVWVKGGYTLDTLDKAEVEVTQEIGAKIVLLPLIGEVSTTSLVSKIRCQNPSTLPETKSGS